MSLPIPSAPDSPCRCSILGVTRNTDNYGVRVLLSSIVDLMRKRLPDAEISVLDYGRTAEVWREETASGAINLPLINLRFSWKLLLPNNVFTLVLVALIARCLFPAALEFIVRRNRWLQAIRNSRYHYAISGGDSFSDIYGLRRFFYVALPQVLVLLLGGRLVLLPQTYGPFRTRTARFVARQILQHAESIHSRDLEGISYVSRLLDPQHRTCTHVPDLGFAMSPSPLPRSVADRLSRRPKDVPLIGVNVSSLLYMGGYSRDNMFNLRCDFPTLVREIIAHSILELGADVLLIPHVCGGPLSEEDETRLCATIHTELAPRFGERLLLITDHLDHRQVKALIGACNVFTGARMHACVAAVSQGVPSLCLAYSSKFRGVMSDLGRGARVVDLREATQGMVIEQLADVFRSRGALAADLQSRMSVLLSAQRRALPFFDAAPVSDAPRPQSEKPEYSAA